MLTERLQQLIDAMKDLPPEEQDRVASALQVIQQPPPITSHEVRPAVQDAFDQVMTHSTAVLDCLRER